MTRNNDATATLPKYLERKRARIAWLASCGHLKGTIAQSANLTIAQIERVLAAIKAHT
jgi:hypothetical protein